MLATFHLSNIQFVLLDLKSLVHNRYLKLLYLFHILSSNYHCTPISLLLWLLSFNDREIQEFEVLDLPHSFSHTNQL
jgi:hypothetical protein